MPSFDGLSVRNILLLGRDGRGTSSLGSPAALPFHTDDEDIIALMAAATRTQKPQEREHGRTAPLLEVLYNLPQTLRDGRISWLLLPGEEIPSTIIIHQDLTTEHLRQLATWRLLHLNLENMTRHRFSPSYLGGLRYSQQAQELAADASLGSSEPIAPYLEQAYPPLAVTGSISLPRGIELLPILFGKDMLPVPHLHPSSFRVSCQVMYISGSLSTPHSSFFTCSLLG